MIVGVGQLLAGDDGVGRVVARRLRDRGVPAEEAGDGAALLELFARATGRVVVIDAAASEAPPGTVFVVPPSELARTPLVSTHGLSIAEALALAPVTRGAPLDVAVVAVAIAPARARPAGGEGLSPEVAAAVPIALRLALALSRE